VGFGFYFSTKNTKKPFPVYDNNAFADKRLDIKYITTFYQYILVRKRYYELHLPLEIGLGQMQSDFIYNGRQYKSLTDNFTIGAAGAQFIIKPVRWAGISTILGYRAATQKVIDGAFYAVGIWVGFKPITTDANYYMKRRKYRKAVQGLGSE
jgi:hypothetical protein